MFISLLLAHFRCGFYCSAGEPSRINPSAEGKQECVSLMWTFEVHMLSELWSNIGKKKNLKLGGRKQGWKEGREQQQICWWFLWLWAVSLDARGRPRLALAPTQIPAVISTGLPATAVKEGFIYSSCKSAFTLQSVQIENWRGKAPERHVRIIPIKTEVWKRDLPVQVPLKGNEEGELSEEETLF